MLRLWNVRIVGSRFGKGRGSQSGMQEGLSWRLPFPPLSPAILEPDLHAGLAEGQAQGQLFTSKDVGIRGPLERLFQLLQLVPRERGPGLLLLAAIALAVAATAAALVLLQLLTIISRIPGSRVLQPSESCESAASVRRRKEGQQ